VADSELTASGDGPLQRLRRCLVESFTGELLSPAQSAEEEAAGEWRDSRRRNAYRYILLLLLAVVLPVFTYNLAVGQLAMVVGAAALLAVLLGNVALLSTGREAAVSPHVLLFLSIGLVILALYSGQEFALFLLYPLLVALPVLLSMRWAVGIALVSALAVAPLILARADSMTAFAIAFSLGLTWLVSAWLVFAVAEQARRLRGMAITDPLTGVYNRRYLELRARKSLDLWARYGQPESLLIIDIDHFKRINDEFGHATGDRALKGLVDLLGRRVRKVDTLCRFGGEEFVLLLSQADAALAEKVANELREVVASTDILPGIGLTISIGVCDIVQAESVEHWIELADTALYQAKRNGRNRVEVSTAEPVTVVPIAKTVPDWR
jgi:diguanylate cyclase (GGDEF)-like protein